MIYSSIANQGSIWHWARDHRVHHFHSETCADPHDAIRGFWFAHMGWLFLKKDPRVAEAGQKVNLDDLRADPFVMPQKNLDPYWNLFFFFAVGEGWHNWPHKYPFDYAASEYGVLRQYNPTKFVIDCCAAVGLVTERKRATGMWAREQAKMRQQKAE